MNMNTARPRKEKPAYSSVQNIAFIISLAWRERRSVIVFVLAMAAAAILLSLTQLFVVPSILEAVGANVSIAELSAIILFYMRIDPAQRIVILPCSVRTVWAH